MDTTPPSPQLATLIGSSDLIVAVRTVIDHLAESDVSVLVTGPSGSGKEVVAKLLHERGTRAARPFVAINCAAVPRDLLERAILGEAGATPEAVPSRRGRFELAAGGTLFLDEIGGIDTDFQSKLLALLETRRVERGEMEGTPLDVRVIAATNCDLAAAVAAGTFRADLFYRLAVVEIELPSLAARPDDIPLLIEHFAAADASRAPRFAPTALTYLSRQRWPGNVRQLRNFVARAAAVHPGIEIDDARSAVLLHGERREVDRWLASTANPLPLPNRRRPPPLVAADEVVDLKALLNEFEQAYIREALGRTDFGVAESARLLGLRRTTLVEKMRRLNIARPGHDPSLA